MNIRPVKLSFEELFNSSTMFYVNDEFEKKISREVDEKVEELFSELQEITTKEALREYIVSNKESLDNLTSFLEISIERFKRMVSMIRKDRGFVFGSEWNLGKIRKVMMESPAMMESILNLIWMGKADEKLIKKIPSFYLENMVIDGDKLLKLQDRSSIRSFVKKGMEGKYSNAIGDQILDDVEKVIKEACAVEGLDYSKNCYVPFLRRTVSFVIDIPEEPKVLIDVSYSVTTSSGQTKKKEEALKTAKDIASCPLSKKPIYVYFLDGAGWVGRQADMKEIQKCSDYVVNFQNLGVLEDIILANT